jgi:hypothetical protein
MTEKHTSAFSRLMAPELVRNSTLGINRGRRECPAIDAPMAPCAMKSTGVGTTGTPDQPTLPAQWFYGFNRIARYVHFDYLKNYSIFNMLNMVAMTMCGNLVQRVALV